jgi:hypothetical protein
MGRTEQKVLVATDTSCCRSAHLLTLPKAPWFRKVQFGKSIRNWPRAFKPKAELLRPLPSLTVTEVVVPLLLPQAGAVAAVAAERWCSAGSAKGSAGGLHKTR